MAYGGWFDDMMSGDGTDGQPAPAPPINDGQSLLDWMTGGAFSNPSPTPAQSPVPIVGVQTSWWGNMSTMDKGILVVGGLVIASMIWRKRK